MDTTNTQNTQIKDKENKEILEIFNNLPKIIQDAITKSGWETILRGIVSKYRLRIDQGTKLENMTFGLMMGVMDPQEYFDLLHTDFGLEKDDADALFQDLDEKIFGLIQDIVMRQEKEEENDKIEQNFEEKTDKNYPISREEVLRDIENPEQIGVPNDLPDLKGSVVMPNMNNAEKPSNVSAPVPTKSVEIREEQITGKVLTNPVVSKEVPNTKTSIDPVQAGLNSVISTSNKDYKADPYREPIE